MPYFSTLSLLGFFHNSKRINNRTNKTLIIMIRKILSVTILIIAESASYLNNFAIGLLFILCLY